MSLAIKKLTKQYETNSDFHYLVECLKPQLLSWDEDEFKNALKLAKHQLSGKDNNDRRSKSKKAP